MTSGTTPGTLTLNSITTADVTGGTGNNNFDITQWTGAGSIIGGVGATSTANSITDYTTTNGSYIYFSNSGISVGMPGDPTEYRPLIALSNLQTINLSGPAGTKNINFSDQGWSGTANVTGVAGVGNAVLISSQTTNTTFTLADSSISTSIISGGTPVITSVVFTTDIQYFNVFGGPGNNIYNVSSFNLTANIGAGGTSNTIVAAEDANFAVSNNGMSVGSNGTDGIFNFSAGPNWGLNISTVAGIGHTVTVSSFLGTGTLSAGTGTASSSLAATRQTATWEIWTAWVPLASQAAAAALWRFTMKTPAQATAPCGTTWAWPLLPTAVIRRSPTAKRHEPGAALPTTAISPMLTSTALPIRPAPSFS